MCVDMEGIEKKKRNKGMSGGGIKIITEKRKAEQVV